MSNQPDASRASSIAGPAAPALDRLLTTRPRVTLDAQRSISQARATCWSSM